MHLQKIAIVPSIAIIVFIGVALEARSQIQHGSDKVLIAESLQDQNSPPVFYLNIDMWVKGPSAVNARKQPNKTADIIARPKKGDKVKVTGRVQNKNWYRVLLEGDTIGYIFGENFSTKNLSNTHAQSTSTQNPARELRVWYLVQDSKDVAVFEEYLTKFPQGSFANLAKRRIKQLKDSFVPVTDLRRKMWVKGSGNINVRALPDTKARIVGSSEN